MKVSLPEEPSPSLSRTSGLTADDLLQDRKNGVMRRMGRKQGKGVRKQRAAVAHRHACKRTRRSEQEGKGMATAEWRRWRFQFPALL